MATTAERQRKRRQRLSDAGFNDVTVTVSKADKETLRRFAHSLRDGQAPGLFAGTRLPAVIRSLRAARAELERLGVVHAGVFGSTARGEDRPDSDVDVAIDVDSERIRDVIDMIRVIEAVRAALPGVPTDVADRRTLKPGIRERAEQEMIHAF